MRAALAKGREVSGRRRLSDLEESKPTSRVRAF